MPTIGSSPPVSENEEGGIDVGIGDVILDENGQPLTTQPPVVIKQGGKEQIKVTDDGISLKENVVIDKSLSVTQDITTLGGINAQGTSLLSGTTTFTGLTNFDGPTTFTNPVTFNEVASDPAPTDGKIYRKSDGLYFNGSKLLTEGQGGKWVDGDSSGDIVYNGGNVGIGTATPSAPLEVVGNLKGQKIDSVVTSGHNIQLVNDADTSPSMLFSGLNHGVGLNYEIGIDHVDSNNNKLVFKQISDTHALVRTSMVIDSNGKIGIGTTSPDTNLEIKDENPTIRLKDETSVSNYSDIRTNDGVLLLQADDGNNVANSKIQFDIDGSDKMTIESDGAIKLNDTASAPTTTTNKLYSVSSVLYWGGNKILTGAAASGGSGSGAGSGGVTIEDISGLETALANKLDKPDANAESAFVDSDINLKTNISPIQSPIKSLESIRGVNFEWKEKSNKSGEDQGLIAQEVEKIIPSAVKKGEDGYLKVDYTKLVPFLLEAVKDLSERVKELEKN